MSKKKSNKGPEKESFKQANYYELHTKAVDDLVTADESNSPEVPESELRKYRSGFKRSIPDWLKFVFIKWWFAAAVCFFFFWGLGNYVGNMLDMLFITAIALGVVTDILTNNAIRFLEKVPGSSARWLMFPKKGYYSFPVNILYAFVVLFFVFMTYTLTNNVLVTVFHQENIIPVEPILFGLCFMGWDVLFVSIKRKVKDIIRGARAPGRDS